MTPLKRLFERDGLRTCGLPPPLAALYDGDLGLPRPGLIANFVSSIDGVVALPGIEESGHLISGKDEADRFIMGLLRALVDVVMIGAGTFRMARGACWFPESIYPEAGEGFVALRQQLGLSPNPQLAIVTDTGDLDLTQPAIQDALILATPAGGRQMEGRLPGRACLSVVDAPQCSGRAMVDVLQKKGLMTILVEGGPTFLGQMIGENLIDELFLTISPLLFGCWPADGRKSLVEGLDLAGRSRELMSVRRHESHLYMRYARGAMTHHTLT